MPPLAPWRSRILTQYPGAMPRSGPDKVGQRLEIRQLLAGESAANAPRGKAVAEWMADPRHPAIDPVVQQRFLDTRHDHR